jgi:hypothetical protein
MNARWQLVSFLILVSSWVQADEGDGAPIAFAEASREVPKPRAIWTLVKQHMVPPEFTIRSDEVVVSDTDPAQRLRKVTGHFWSQELAGKK